MQRHSHALVRPMMSPGKAVLLSILLSMGEGRAQQTAQTADLAPDAPSVSSAASQAVTPPPTPPTPAASTAAPQPKQPSSSSSVANKPKVPEARVWAKAPRVIGRLTAADVGVVINTEDIYSVKVGEYYAKARGLSEQQVLRVSLPVKSALTKDEFIEFSRKIDQFFGDKVQALALAWRMPYGVECNSITGALAMGFDAELCKNVCAPSRPSRYFGSASTRPYQDYKMRLGMLLAASSVDDAVALIDRGIKSDHTLGLRGGPPANAHFVTTSDAVRSVRQYFFPPAGPVPVVNMHVYLDQTDALKYASRVMLYMTGRGQVDHLDTIDFLPGALADHLTSFGGVLDKPHGQMTVLSWIGAGATASYGTTSEPCSHWQKFPHPQALLLFYAQGATAIESYWKSVLWPQQGLFVGEPLAAPFDRSKGMTPDRAAK